MADLENLQKIVDATSTKFANSETGQAATKAQADLSTLAGMVGGGADKEDIDKYAKRLADDMTKMTVSLKAAAVDGVAGATDGLNLLKATLGNNGLTRESDDQLKADYYKAVADGIKTASHGQIDLAAPQQGSGKQATPLDTLQSSMASVDKDLAASLGDMNKLLHAENMNAADRTKVINEIEKDLQTRGRQEDFGTAELNNFRRGPGPNSVVSTALSALEQAKSGDANAYKRAETYMEYVARGEYVKAGEHAEQAYLHGATQAEKNSGKAVIDVIASLPGGDKVLAALNADQQAIEKAGNNHSMAAVDKPRGAAGQAFQDVVEDAVQKAKGMIKDGVAMNEPPQMPHSVPGQGQTAEVKRSV